jgi:hypothetical protein
MVKDQVLDLFVLEDKINIVESVQKILPSSVFQICAEAIRKIEGKATKGLTVLQGKLVKTVIRWANEYLCMESWIGKFKDFPKTTRLTSAVNRYIHRESQKPRDLVKIRKKRVKRYQELKNLASAVCCA